MYGLQSFMLNLCPVNVLRPTFPYPMHDDVRAAVIEIYKDAVLRDTDGFNRMVQEVYGLDLVPQIPVNDYDSTLAYYSKNLANRGLSYQNLVKLNRYGCIWRTTPKLYRNLQHSFHGKDGSARSTYHAALSCLLLSITCINSAFKVSPNPIIRYAHSFACLALLNALLFFTNFVELLIGISLINMAILFYITRNIKDPPVVTADDNEDRSCLKMIFHVRGCITVLTVIAILAYDNIYFNRLFSKTFYSGFSTMDAGSSIMLTLSGCMTGLSRKDKRRSLLTIIKRNWLLFLLGAIRTLSTAGLDYDVPVEEYGVHMNFFMVLGFTKLCRFAVYTDNMTVVSEIIISFVPTHLLLLVPLAMTISYEALLIRYDVLNVFPSLPRETILSANKEGIAAIPNSTSLYLLGYLATKYLGSLYNEKKFVEGSLFISGSLTCCMLGSLLLYYLGLPTSRTLVCDTTSSIHRI
ncbi:hypothetical protein BgAZ_305730 [Babesia gibsoni]|uniref:GPI-anchored wall transfer protein 1 n=1 Tax=Babesia gibsoni TaxID=33632 RepID=A0AAD8P913_BABGI|nr:hypothetical protein BgAZ_305730 [Babesia gibsoni]